MPKLTMKVKDRQNMFGAGLDRRIRVLLDAEEAARERAARMATSRTRSNFKYRRNSIAPRRGRSSSGGRMRQHLSWSDNGSMVEFNIKEADLKVPHWVVQEIGTGQRATIREANKSNPVGRPRKGATYVRTVRSQKGRPIKTGLVFATGGRYSPPNSRRDEQLVSASTVTGVPTRRNRPRMVINKEIEGQHFVKRGGTAAFRQYESTVLAAARQAFRKSKTS